MRQSHSYTVNFLVITLIFLASTINAKTPEKPEEIWTKEKDFSLVPLKREKLAGAPAAMPGGGYFRYGPQQILIYVEENEPIQFMLKHQHGIGWFYSIEDRDGKKIKSGRSIQSEFITCPTQGSGIYSLTFDTKGNWGLLNILNQYAVIKASSAKHHISIIHGTGKSKGLYFFVPEKTDKFSICVIAPESDVSLNLQVFAPSGEKIMDERGDFDKFVEKQIEVAEGMNGVWRLTVGCKGDSKLYLKGIPPYLSNSPIRLLVPADMADR